MRVLSLFIGVTVIIIAGAALETVLAQTEKPFLLPSAQINTLPAAKGLNRATFSQKNQPRQLAAMLYAPSKVQGTVYSGMVTWQCNGTQCLGTSRFGVGKSVCVPLVKQVGEVWYFGVVRASYRRPTKAQPLVDDPQVMDAWRCNLEAQMDRHGDMISTSELQKAIQERAQSNTLGTQMMRNINDSRAKILRNIR